MSALGLPPSSSTSIANFPKSHTILSKYAADVLKVFFFLNAMGSDAFEKAEMSNIGGTSLPYKNPHFWGRPLLIHNE
jgi:hypothetical protein